MVLVHGSIVDARRTWRHQFELAERWTLIVSAFEAVCDAIADRLHAERDTIAGRGHTIPSPGAPYNARLEAFLRA